MAELSDKQKKELSDAVEQVMTYCDDGLSPNEAIAKTAQAMNLTEDRLPVLVNSYNIGATAAQWQNSNSIREKTSSFPIADVDGIRDILYPKQEKSASVPYRSCNNDFVMSAKNLFRIEKKTPARSKEAPMAYKSASYVQKKIRDLDEEITRKIHKQCEMAKTAMFGFEEDVHDCLSDVANKMLLPDVPDGESLMKMIGDTMGPMGKTIVIRVKSQFPRAEKKHWNESCLSCDHPFMQAMEKAIDAVDTLIEKQKEYAEMLDQCVKIMKPIVDSNKVEEKELSADDLLTTDEDIAMQEKESAYTTDISAFKNGPTTEVDQYVNPQWRNMTRRSYDLLQQIHSAKQDQRIQQLKSNTTLVDLMNTDDYLSQQDPAVVLNAYNDLMEVAPTIRSQKITLAKALKEYIATEGLDLSSLYQLGRESREQEEVFTDRQDRRSIMSDIASSAPSNVNKDKDKDKDKDSLNRAQRKEHTTPESNKNGK